MTHTTIKNCSEKCDRVRSSDDEEGVDWHSSQSLAVWAEDYTACGGALEVHGTVSVNHMLGEQLTGPEHKPEEEEEFVEHKATSQMHWKHP
jgi:hypothetical protein